MIIDTENLDAKSPAGPGASRPAQPGPSILTSGPTSPIASSSSRGAIYTRQSDHGLASGYGSYGIGGEDEPTPRGAATSQTQPLLSTIDMPPPPNYQAALASPVVSLPPHQHSLYRYDALRGEVWEDVRVKRAVERRFFKAFAVAIVVWVLFILLGKTLAGITVEIGDGTPSKVLPVHGVGLQCYKGSSEGWKESSVLEPPNHSSLPKYRATLNLTLPLDVAGLYLLAAGQLTHGTVELREAPPSKARMEHVHVSIEARYYTKVAFQRLSVCELEGESRTRGLGIYTPTYPSGKFPVEHQIDVHITLTIPTTFLEDLYIPSFRTNVPNFAHVLLELNRVNFGRLDLEGSNAVIAILKANVGDASFKTTNSAVGIDVLRASRPITVQTTNAAVDIPDLTLTANDAWTTMSAIVSTTNARVELAASLESAQQYSTFVLNASTTNASGRIVIHQAPLLSQQHLNVRTTNGAAEILLHPTFEGSVDVSGARADVEVMGELDDWTGHGRTYAARRHRKAAISKRHWLGQIGYESYEGRVPRNFGSVEARTTKSLASVSVPCLYGQCHFDRPHPL